MGTCWQYSTIHNTPCRILEEQSLWGRAVCRVWLPNQDALVRVPQSALQPLYGKYGEAAGSRFGDLVTAGWDLVVDKAYRLGGNTEQVARYKLGRGLTESAPYMLLLTRIVKGVENA